MKKFILNTFYFIVPFIVIIYGHIIIINNSKNWELPNKSEYVFLGNSHPECAFNDSLIYNFKNLALSGESYFYTYLKFIKIVEGNPQIKAAFIEFGPLDVIESEESRIWGDIFINIRFPLYFSMMKLSEFNILFKNNFKAILNIPPKAYIKQMMYSYNLILKKEDCKILKNSEYGGYLYLKRNKVDSLINTKLTTNNIIVDNLNISYMGKILELCEKNRIKVYFIKSPTHSMFYQAKREKVYEDIINKQFSNIVFLDFGEFPLEDKEYGDLGHLNYKGAKVFSLWFEDLIKNGLLKEKEKEIFVRNRIKELLEKKKCFN